MNTEPTIHLPRNVGVITYSRTGSSYTVEPPVTDTDIDYLVLVQDFCHAIKTLSKAGWTMCSGDYDEDEGFRTAWDALRKGVFNVMVTDDLGWYQRAVDATYICKRRNIKDKKDRIIVFLWVRDGLDLDGRASDKMYQLVLQRWPL
uniref:Resolvase/invertase-type recombinase catalytic domain-containing protein n=1 Tax=Xanthomonas phage MK21 TaxID=3148942 RepID=A0AAU7J8U8_9CAUD